MSNDASSTYVSPVPSLICEICDTPIPASHQARRWLPSIICFDCAAEHESDLVAMAEPIEDTDPQGTDDEDSDDCEESDEVVS